MSQLVFGVIILVGLIVNMTIGALIIVGALQMLRLKSRTWATLASVLALVPCNPVSLIGIPIAIWSLVALNRQRVKDAFDAPRTGATSRKVSQSSQATADS